ncbi:MAG: PorT family protein [Bacteroidales bacterium]|nr:PorT family protein [Bacteroidales bacterium]
MKKAIFAALAAAFVFNVGVYAQQYNNVRGGIVGGVTSSSTKLKEVTTKSISKYHIGVVGEFPLGAGFAIQPELIYQMKGMALNNMGESTVNDAAKSLETKFGYIELPVQIQWGPDLVAFRPYGFIEPFAGYQISAKSDEVTTVGDELEKIEYGMSLGAGIDISHFQVSAKYFWNFGNVYRGDIKNTANTITGLKDGNNFNGFVISLAIFF